MLLFSEHFFVQQCRGTYGTSTRRLRRPRWPETLLRRRCTRPRHASGANRRAARPRLPLSRGSTGARKENPHAGVRTENKSNYKIARDGDSRALYQVPPTTLDEEAEVGGQRARQGTAVGCSSSRSLLSAAPRWWWRTPPARRGRGCNGTAAGGAARARPGLWIAAPLMVTRVFQQDVGGELVVSETAVKEISRREGGKTD